MAGWLITEKFAETNDGQPMEFSVFEDLTGLYDATFFPEVFQKYGHLLTGGKPYLVEGLVEEDLGECTLTVKRLEVVNQVIAHIRKCTELCIPSSRRSRNAPPIEFLNFTIF